MLFSTRARNGAALLAGLIGLLLPSLAGAAAFTISAPIAINDAASGVVGTLSPSFGFGFLEATSANTYGFQDTLDILFFEFSLDAGSADVDQLGVGGAGVAAVGSAFLAGSGDQDPNQTAGVAMELAGSSALFNFEHLSNAPGNLQAGESTGLLAVAFNLGDLPPPGIGPVQILADMATFMISSGADFSVNALVVPVPEPGTALLFGLGLAGLATIRKR